MERTVYLAGKITGENYSLCFAKFKATQDILEGIGFTVINPMVLVPKGTSQKESMKILIPKLLGSDTLFLLPDFKNSPGASVELEIAKYCGIDVVLYEQLTSMQWSS